MSYSYKFLESAIASFSLCKDGSKNYFLTSSEIESYKKMITQDPAIVSINYVEMDRENVQKTKTHGEELLEKVANESKPEPYLEPFYDFEPSAEEMAPFEWIIDDKRLEEEWCIEH